MLLKGSRTCCQEGHGKVESSRTSRFVEGKRHENYIQAISGRLLIVLYSCIFFLFFLYSIRHGTSEAIY